MASYVFYPGDGVQTDWAVPFPYLSKTHVKVSIADTPVAFSWISNTIIRVSPAVASGVVLLVQRITDKTPLTQFANTNNLTAENLTLAETQTLYIAEEARDAASISGSNSSSALSTSAEALTNSETATGLATSAVATANSASAKADAAEAKSNTAISTANDAKQAAQDAAEAAETLAEAVGVHNADDLPYDNTRSGLSAATVQEAVDTIAAASGIIDLNSDNVTNASDVTGVNVSDALDILSAGVNGKSPLGHTHTAADITDFAAAIGYTVQYGSPQSLSPEQKAQALSNIGAQPAGSYQQALGYTPVNKAGDTISGGLTVGGDIYCANGTVRSYGFGGSANSGAVFLNAAADRYLYWNGTQYTLNGAHLYTAAGRVLGSSDNIVTSGRLVPGGDNFNSIGAWAGDDGRIITGIFLTGSGGFQQYRTRWLQLYSMTAGWFTIGNG